MLRAACVAALSSVALIAGVLPSFRSAESRDGLAARIPEVVPASGTDFHQSSDFTELSVLLGKLHAQGQFNGTLLLAEKGTVTFSRSWGFADETKRTSINDATIFELASVAKQFTAMAVAILHEQGKLRFDDPVTRFLPELPNLGAITVRNLLNHTSGIPDYLPKQALFDENTISGNREVLLAMAKAELAPKFPPNTKYEYSNTGYVLLATIIERVSGETFADFMQKRIFSQLGMTRTFVYSRRLAPRPIDNYAFGYMTAKDLKTKMLPDSFPPTRFVVFLDGAVGDGNISSTAGDLLKWDRALASSRLISPETQRDMFTPATLSDGKKTTSGLGWVVENHPDFGSIVWHSGSIPGYRTYFERHLTNDKTVILLQNTNDAVLPRLNIRQALYRKPLTAVFRIQTSVSEERLNALVGDFQGLAPDGPVISLTRGERWLVYNSTTNRGWDLPLFPESESKFFSKALDIQIEFGQDSAGGDVLKLLQGGKEVGRARRTK